jgi:hypothetical protein
MDDKTDRDEDDAEAGSRERSDTTINDPLTRGDVEAPRAEFRGRTPE